MKISKKELATNLMILIKGYEKMRSDVEKDLNEIVEKGDDNIAFMARSAIYGLERNKMLMEIKLRLGFVDEDEEK